ncbi:MAG: radical SAM protein [Akkermansiaceae bacterium]|nr:radical SAM protein [Akkermansiaceae bacterium]MCP5550634.1 radical SAM protein [Akkermansiaceae bacterium]
MLLFTPKSGRRLELLWAASVELYCSAKKNHTTMNLKPITSSIYSIPSGDEWLIWAPHAGSVFATNRRGANALRDLKKANGEDDLSRDAETLLGYLRDSGMLKEPAIQNHEQPAHSFKPTSAYILPTNKCNLRCVYCFSFGGDSKDDMDLAQAFNTVDDVLRNAKERSRPATIVFHGGGEPTMNWSVVTKATERLRSEGARLGVETSVRMVSNGVYNSRQIEWVATNIDWLSLSIDGVPDVQDAQRPMRNGSHSSEAVLETCRRLAALDFRFGVRSTVTDEGVERMPEFVSWIAPMRPVGIQFEPLTECGRCDESGAKPPSPSQFIDCFKKAFLIGQRLRIPVLYSGARINKVSASFCGATGKNFIVAPNGFVTACHRVTTPQPNDDADFIFGSMSRDGEITIFQDRLATLNKLTNLPPACESCYCRWNCAGGCYEQNRTESGRLHPVPGSDRCHINKELMRFQLADMVDMRRRTERNQNNGNKCNDRTACCES